METSHPALILLRNKLNLDDFFYPKFDKKLDSFIGRGIELLKNSRQKLWEEPKLKTDAKFMRAIREIKISNMIRPESKNSLAFFILNRSGVRHVRQLSQRNLEQLNGIISSGHLVQLVKLATPLRLRNFDNEDRYMHWYNGKWVKLSKLTAKDLRKELKNEIPICVYKCGLILNPCEAKSWLRALNSVRSTAHKNVMLRYLHGDIYSQERLFRFGLSDSACCDICGEIETIDHKLINCRYALGLWEALAGLLGIRPNEIDANFITGAHELCSSAVLTLHSEIISILMKKLRLVHITPETQLQTIIVRLAKKEQGAVKRELEALLR